MSCGRVVSTLAASYAGPAFTAPIQHQRLAVGISRLLRKVTRESPRNAIIIASFALKKLGEYGTVFRGLYFQLGIFTRAKAGGRYIAMDYVGTGLILFPSSTVRPPSIGSGKKAIPCNTQALSGSQYGVLFKLRP